MDCGEFARSGSFHRLDRDIVADRGNSRVEVFRRRAPERKEQAVVGGLGEQRGMIAAGRVDEISPRSRQPILGCT